MAVTGEKRRKSNQWTVEESVTEESHKKKKVKDESSLEESVMEQSPKKKKVKTESLVEEPVANGVEKKDQSVVTDVEPHEVEGKKNPDVAGSWTCSGCSVSNHCKRYNCKKCNEAKPAPAGTTTEKKKDDWKCSKCQNTNFGFRGKCRRCKTPNAAGGAPDFKDSGDWSCPGCGFSNFKSRSKCKKCSVLKTAAGETAFSKDDDTSPETTEKKKKSKEDSEESKKSKNQKSLETKMKRKGFGKRKPGCWRCTSCSFSNFDKRSTCKQCDEAKPTDAGDSRTAAGRDWQCKGCGSYNFPHQDNCKQCAASYTEAQHGVGMSHMPLTVTEEQVKEFFSPLTLLRVNLITRGKKPQGKATVTFKSHEEAVTAMEKDQKKMGEWSVNLYLNSTDTAAGENVKPAETDEMEVDTAEAEQSSSETTKKRYKWDKVIRSCLKTTDKKTMSVKKLVKVLLPLYREEIGKECGVEELQAMLEQRLGKSSKFTCKDGNVSL